MHLLTGMKGAARHRLMCMTGPARVHTHNSNNSSGALWQTTSTNSIRSPHQLVQHVHQVVAHGAAQAAVVQHHDLLLGGVQRLLHCTLVEESQTLSIDCNEAGTGQSPAPPPLQGEVGQRTARLSTNCIEAGTGRAGLLCSITTYCLAGPGACSTAEHAGSSGTRREWCLQLPTAERANSCSGGSGSTTGSRRLPVSAATCAASWSTPRHRQPQVQLAAAPTRPQLGVNVELSSTLLGLQPNTA